MKILASKTAFVSSEHLSLVFQMGGSNASTEGSVFWWGFFLSKEWQKGAIVLHTSAYRKAFYKVMFVMGPTGKFSASQWNVIDPDTSKTFYMK